MWIEYITPSTLQEALEILAQKGSRARLAAGTTDLMLELERGVRPGIETLIDITRLPGLDYITLDPDGIFHIGTLVTHNDVAASSLLRANAFPLVSASWQVGAPQIRNRATVVGNLVTASPANDTITPLIALGARVELQSKRGLRQVPLSEFYTGVRKTVLGEDEILVEITFPSLAPNQHGTFLKLGLRRAQAISIVNSSVILTLDSARVVEAVITLGAVAPVIIHAPEAEQYLKGNELTEEVISRAGELAAESARPIDDIRGSAAYRRAMVRTLVMRALRMLRDQQEKEQVPEHPILLKTPPGTAAPKPSSFATIYNDSSVISTRINGKAYEFKGCQRKSLLRLLREDAGLTGTKEGCAEGECGACTVYLDGKAVMACLIPAPRADGAEIVTVEGLARGDDLHPVQEAFISQGAVQCGYCTPGFIMSAAKLLEEQPHPTHQQVMQAITGNLCRCTGYYKIVQAIEAAGKMRE